MTEHSHELHYWFIWFVRLQCYSDCHLQIVKRKTLYFLHHWWWRYHSWKDSWNVASMNISNSWFIKLHCIQLRFSVHLHSLKVSLQTTEHFSLIVHHLSLSDQRSKQMNQSECQAISSFLLFIHAEWLIQVTTHDQVCIDIWESERICACRYIDYLVDKAYDRAYRWRKKWKNE